MSNTSAGRLKGLDFARVLCTVGITAFHFYCHSSSYTKLFYVHANGAWGGVLNYLFFALSGLVIHNKYGENIGTVKQFYLKRWKAMLPAYILVFLFAYLLKVAAAGKFFYLPIPKPMLLLSFLGLDGYTQWITQTYMITGEWFLGAILIAYAVYPLLRICFKKSPELTVLAAIALYAVFRTNSFSWMPWVLAVNPFTCIMNFTIGMYLATKIRYLKNPIAFIASSAIVIALLCIPIGGNNVSKESIIGCALLIVLFNIGELVMKAPLVCKAFTSLSAITYPVFLIHHEIIYKVLSGWDTTSTKKSLAILVVIVVITFSLGKVLNIVMDRLLRKKTADTVKR